MLVCKAWRDYFYEENPLAIDWGWQNDYPLRFSARHGFEDRVFSLLRNPVVNPAALNNAPLAAACSAGHFNIAAQLLRVTPLNPSIEMLIVSLFKKHQSIAKLLIESGRVDLRARPPSIQGLEAQQELATKHRCSLALVLASEMGDHPDVVLPLYRLSPSTTLLLRNKCWNCLDHLIEEIRDLRTADFEPALLARLAQPIEPPVLSKWLQRLSADVSVSTLLTKLQNPEAIERLLLHQGCSDSFLQSREFADQLLSASKSGHLPLLQTLTKSSPNIPWELLQSAFLVSVESNHLESVAHFLTLPQCDPSFKNNEAICIAAAGESIELLQTLLKEPGVASWTQQNKPLRIACKLAKAKVVECLLASSPRCLVDQGCLELAFTSSNEEFLRAVLSGIQSPIELTCKMLQASLDQGAIEVLVEHYPSKLAISSTSELKKLVQLLLLRGEMRWLAYFVDSRILLWDEVARIFKAKHFNQVNRERTELQATAIPFFRGLLGTSVGRLLIDIKMASYMIFSLAKHKEWLALISAASHPDDFMGQPSQEEQDLFKAKICIRLCSAGVEEQTGRIFFKSVKFLTESTTIAKAQKEIRAWQRLHEGELITPILATE